MFKRKPKPRNPEPQAAHPLVMRIGATQATATEYRIPLCWDHVTWTQYRTVVNAVKAGPLTDSQAVTLLTGIPPDHVVEMETGTWNAVAEALLFVRELPDPEPLDHFTYQGVEYACQYGSKWGRFMEAESALQKHKGDVYAAAVEVMAATFTPTVPPPTDPTKTHPVPPQAYSYRGRIAIFADLPAPIVLGALLFFCEVGRGSTHILRLAVTRLTTANVHLLSAKRHLTNGGFLTSIWVWLVGCILRLTIFLTYLRIRSSIFSLGSTTKTKTTLTNGLRRLMHRRRKADKDDAKA